MKNELMNQFKSAMLDIYKRAKIEAKYNASRYLQMLHENGALETAQILINSSSVSEGYAALWERQRLDLTVEAVIWDNSKFHELFSKDELQIIENRLIEYQYFS